MNDRFLHLFLDIVIVRHIDLHGMDLLVRGAPVSFNILPCLVEPVFVPGEYGDMAALRMTTDGLSQALCRWTRR